MGPKEWHPQPVEFRQLRAFTRRLETLEQMLGLETNRLESAPASIRPSTRRMIRSLKKEIDGVVHLLKDHIDNHPDLKHHRVLLLSIPGIGEKTACLLLGEIVFNQFFSARAVAAYAGLTPRKSQSGTSVIRTRLSKLGSGRIRKALYFPAITAVKYNQVVIQLAQRLEKNGNPPMQIVCASMRKLLHIAFGVIKNNCPFNPNPASYI